MPFHDRTAFWQFVIYNMFAQNRNYTELKWSSSDGLKGFGRKALLKRKQKLLRISTIPGSLQAVVFCAVSAGDSADDPHFPLNLLLVVSVSVLVAMVVVLLNCVTCCKEREINFKVSSTPCSLCQKPKTTMIFVANKYLKPCVISQQQSYELSGAIRNAILYTAVVIATAFQFFLFYFFYSCHFELTIIFTRTDNRNGVQQSNLCCIMFHLGVWRQLWGWDRLHPSSRRHTVHAVSSWGVHTGSAAGAHAWASTPPAAPDSRLEFWG